MVVHQLTRNFESSRHGSLLSVVMVQQRYIMNIPAIYGNMFYKSNEYILYLECVPYIQHDSGREVPIPERVLECPKQISVA